MSGTRMRIMGAFLAGLAMVGGAFFIERPAPPAEATTEDSGIMRVSDRSYIPVVDSDADGQPDWRTQLAALAPTTGEDASSTEPYVPPSTVGGQFGMKLFEDQVTLRKMGIYEDNKDGFLELARQELETLTAAPIYTEADLKNVVTVTNKEGLRTYGNLVAGTIFFYQTDDEHEYEIYQRFVFDKNPKHLEKLAVIEQQYTDMIEALLVLQVPEKYTFEHLAVVNSLSEMRQNVVGMQLYLEDPLYAYARFSRFVGDVLGMNETIFSLHDALYLDEQIQFGEIDALPILVELYQ